MPVPLFFHANPCRMMEIIQKHNENWTKEFPKENGTNLSHT